MEGTRKESPHERHAGAPVAAAWSPYIRYDCRRDEVDEVGAWFDLLTDCLGYRVLFAHETSYTRIDNSKEPCDNRVCFFIYLRAFGPGSMLDMARF